MADMFHSFQLGKVSCMSQLLPDEVANISVHARWFIARQVYFQSSGWQDFSPGKPHPYNMQPCTKDKNTII